MTNQPPPEEELREWERLERIATPAPWTWEAGRLTHHPSIPRNAHPLEIFPEVDGLSFDADGRWVAAARTGWPRTIAALREAQARAEREKALADSQARCLAENAAVVAECEQRIRAKDREIEELRTALVELANFARCDLVEAWEDPDTTKYELGEIAGSHIERWLRKLAAKGTKA